MSVFSVKWMRVIDTGKKMQVVDEILVSIKIKAFTAELKYTEYSERISTILSAMYQDILREIFKEIFENKYNIPSVTPAVILLHILP